MKSILALVSLIIILSCSTSVVKEKIEFQTLADMNYHRYGFGSTSDSNYIYAICGGTNETPGISSSIEKYDISKNKWSILTEKIIPRRYCNAELIRSQNKIYIFNGEYKNSNMSGIVKRLEIYDLTTNQVSFGTDVPLSVKKADSDVWDNKIYFYGGEDSHGFSDRLYEYDPVTAIWKRLPDMPHAKETSGKIIDGILYVFGGYDSRHQMLTKISKYDIKESTWTELGDLPFAVSAHATASDSRRIWLVGSYEDLQYLAYYDTKTTEFKKFTSNMADRRHAKAQIIDNILYVYGGTQNSFSSSSLSITQSADISFVK